VTQIRWSGDHHGMGACFLWPPCMSRHHSLMKSGTPRGCHDAEGCQQISEGDRLGEPCGLAAKGRHRSVGGGVAVRSLI
jgi:hypothetical protein